MESKMDVKKSRLPSNAADPKFSDLLLNLNVYELLALLVTVVVILLSAAFLLWRRAKVARRDVLLMGLCDSGKTLLFSRLLHNKFVKTFTSTKENVGELPVRSKFVKLVDIPGHERLRYKFLEFYKETARGIIFTIDSVTFAKDVRDVAEFLYTILSDSAVQAHRVPVLVACNKQDETMTKSAKVIEAALAKEINVLRLTKSSQLSGTTETKGANTFLGKEGRDFDFAQLATPVEFGETSALKNDKTADVEAIEDWLDQIV